MKVISNALIASEYLNFLFSWGKSTNHHQINYCYNEETCTCETWPMSDKVHCYECSDKLIIYQSGGFSYTWTLKNNKVAVWAFSKQMLIWIFLIILSKHFANISQKLFKLLAFQIMLTFYLLVLIGEQLLNIHNEGWLFSNKGCLGYSKKLANS